MQWGSPSGPGHIQAAGGAWLASSLSQGPREINCTVNNHVLNSRSISTWASRDRLSSHLSLCWLQGCVHHWRRICFAVGIFLQPQLRLGLHQNKQALGHGGTWLAQTGWCRGWPRG